MLIADFTNAKTDTIMISGLFQWDYGQQLEIRGLNLPEMVQIHFSTNKDCGNALRMVGTTLDGVTTVKIPDILLAEQEFCNDIYTIWAFVYVNDESSGETVKRVAIKTKSRPKPEDYTDQGTDDPFADTIEQVKQYADQAEQSVSAAETAQAGAEKAYQDTIEAVEQIKEDNMSMAEKIAIKPTASGTDIVVEDSTDWRLLDFTAQGWTEQVQTEGNQLFEASKLPSKSQGGATVTNNGDGSFTISGSGNLTETFNQAPVDLPEIKLKKGILYIKSDIKVCPYILLDVYWGNTWKKSFSTSANNSAQIEINQEDVENNASIKIRFRGIEGNAIQTGTIYPMLYQDGDGTWEPYSSCYPSPRPEIRTNQLFDASKLPTKSQGGATVTNNEDGSFTISGEGNLTENFYTYYDLSHEDSLKLVKSGSINLRCESVTKPHFSFHLRNASESATLMLSNALKATASGTIEASMLEDENSYVRFGFYAESESTIIPGTIRPMLYQDGDGAWEPYGTVEAWPQPIVSAAEDAKTEEGKYPVTFSITGENLFNAKSINGKTDKGITTEVNEDGNIKLKGSASTNPVRFSFEPEIPTGTYTISKNIKTDFAFGLTSENGLYANGISFSSNGADSVSTQTKESISQLTLNLPIGETIDLNFRIMLNEGSSARPYEPYKSQTVTITSDRPLTKWDKLEKRDGKWGWSYCGKITELVGTENWKIYNNGFYVSGGLDNTSKDLNYLYENKCNFFKRLYSGSSKETGYVLTSTGDSYSPLFQNTIYSDVEEWKNWVKQKKEEMTPLKFAYKTEIEEWVELSPEEQSALNALETYYPTTVIINSANMEMQAKYVADPENYLKQRYESKLETIDAVIERVAALEEQKIKEV